MIEQVMARARTFFTLLVFIFIAGFYSYQAIPKEANPDIPIPVVYISLHYDGISPEDSVNLLIKPMEQELRSIEGIDEMEATAYENGGNIVLQFNAGFDNDKALDDVREKVDMAKSELPSEAEEPVVTEVNFAKFPILKVVLGGAVPERELKQVAKDLQDRLEGISTVLEANISGMREEYIVLEMAKNTFEAYPLNPRQLFDIVNNGNVLIAAGSMELTEGKYAIKVPGLFRRLNDFLNLPLISSGERTVHMRDVADVKFGFKDATSVDRVDGHRAITVSVSKRIGSNVIETVRAVKEVVAESAQQWPETLTYAYTGDASKEIKTMLDDLQNNILFSVVLVMIVVLAALGTRSALLVATAIPGSFLMAIMALYVFGISLNTVVLFALILSVGLLVDGAIVVTELADSYQRGGMKRKQAFIAASKRMAMPIISSTLTTLAAFMPLLFWPDITGEFMKFMPLTLIFTLSASLIMALVFLPLIGAYVPGSATKEQDIFAGLAQRYTDVLNWALARPGKMLGASFAGLVVIAVLYGMFGRGVEFFPRTEAERADIMIRSQGDYNFAERDAVMREIISRIGTVDDAEAVIVTTEANAATGRGNKEDMIGNVFVQPVQFDDRNRSSEAIFDDIIDRIGPMPGVEIELEEQRGGPSDGKPIRLAVVSDDLQLLLPVVNQLKQRLEQTPGAIRVTDSAPMRGIEWRVDVDRAEAQRLGMTLGDIGTIISLTTTGAKLGEYRPEDRNEEIDIYARFRPEDRSFAALDTLMVPTENGNIPISQAITRSPQQKVSTISRLDQKNVIYVTADIAEGYLADTIIQGIKAELAVAALPSGVRVIFKGDDERQARSADFLKKAFVVALIVMALILITQFNSYSQALMILSSVILSTAGVLMGHLIMNKPFGIVMSGLGIIALAGIVVNNNIVLIDTFNKLKVELPTWREALVETGKRRLRPVLMTALTTIIGLLPMALKLNISLTSQEITYNTPSSQWWDQLAGSIVFGLMFATILTLIITPCMLALVERRGDNKR